MKPRGAEVSHLCHCNLPVISKIGTWNQNCCSVDADANVSGTRLFPECVVFSCCVISALFFLQLLRAGNGREFDRQAYMNHI